MNEPAREFVRESRCRSCRAPILWAGSERGKWIPLDREPYVGDSPRGLFVLRGEVAIATTPDAFPGERLYRSHFASCPDFERWRGSRR